jgi:hypothetical protein
MVNESPDKKGIIALIPIVSKQIGAIEKTNKNKDQNYMFRGIDDIFQTVNPIFVEHGMVCVPKVIESVREEHLSKAGKTLLYTFLTMQFTFYAPDGTSIDVITVGEGMDSSDKSAYKALSGAMKYAILQLFCIPTEEAKDPETENHDLCPRGADDPSLLQQMQKHITDIEALSTIQDLDTYVAQHKTSFLASPHRLKISEFCQAKRAELTKSHGE